MATTYRKPGVYLEEGTLTGPGEVGFANAYGLFVGASSQGPTDNATLVNSWSEFEAVYGGWAPVAGIKTNYLPYAVWSFFQNGGRNAWVMRATAAGGVAASAEIKDGGDPTEKVCFVASAKSSGEWGGTASSKGLSVGIDIQQTTGTGPSTVTVFSLHVFKEQGPGFSTEVERFENLSKDGTVPGTKRVDYAVNDEVYGSQYIRISNVDSSITPEQSIDIPIDLIGGVDASAPVAADLTSAVDLALGDVTGPIILNVCGYRDGSDTFISTSYDPSGLTRGDVFVINDNHDKRATGVTSDAYGQAIVTTSGTGDNITSYTGNSYVAAYTPWIVVPDPAVGGGTIVVPPGGAVAGMFARNDANAGVFQAPAGVQYGQLNNALGVDAKFDDDLLGALNSSNINVIRPIAGSGIAAMGGRTRKNYAVDKYINARRTLIFIKESLKRSCEFALFRNNDDYLWAALRGTADMVLRPIWAQNGLKGNSPNDAYIIVCDSSINTPAVIASGEVRMEVSVALQVPAEFIVIRVSQMAGGTTSITEL